MRKELNILHITEATLGGVARHLTYIGPGLSALGCKTSFILSPSRCESDFSQLHNRLNTCDGELHFINMTRSPAPLSDFHAMKKIQSVIKKLNPDIIHSHATKAGLLCRLLKNKFPEKTFLHSPHAFFTENLSSAPLKRIGSMLERFLSRRTDLYILVSDAEKQAALEIGIPDHKLAIVANGLPETIGNSLLSRNQARQELRIHADEFAVVVAGRLTHQKGQDILIRAAADTTLFPQPIRYYLIGDGKQETELQTLSAELGVQDKIQFHGFKPNCFRFFKAFDLAAIPSRFEAMPYVLLEYLTAGVPLIISDIAANFPLPELRELLPVFSCSNSTELAQQINTLYRSPEKRAELSSREKQLSRDHFSLKEQLGKLTAIYRRYE